MYNLNEILAENTEQYSLTKINITRKNNVVEKILVHLQNKVYDRNDISFYYNKISDLIRQFDNGLGLRSAYNKINGNCMLTRFRHESFICIPIAQRSGAKKDKYEAYAIHIEHSIPVKCKREIIVDLFENGIIETAEHLENVLVLLGVGVAMSREAERTVIRNGYASKHPDVDKALTTVDDLLSIRPFARYANNEVIYDMETGNRVDLNATLRELL